MSVGVFSVVVAAATAGLGALAACGSAIAPADPRPQRALALYAYAALFLVLACAALPQTLRGIAAALLVAALGVSLWSDLLCGYILDRVTYPALAFIVATSVATGGISQGVLGAVVSGGALLVLVAVTRGHGMGLGDVKLAAVIGAALGVREGLVALGASFILGAFLGLWRLITHRAERGDRVAFAPYLAYGSIAALLWRGW